MCCFLDAGRTVVLSKHWVICRISKEEMHFVIAGRVKCPEFVYASMIAQRLSERLPKFTYTKISKTHGEWEVREKDLLDEFEEIRH